jgi:glycogen phosphorylase
MAAPLKTHSKNPRPKASKLNKAKTVFFTDGQDPDSYSLANQFAENMEFRLAKDRTNYRLNDAYSALALSMRDRMIRKWLRTQRTYLEQDVKKVYYLSLEFLMGRLLTNTLINLQYEAECRDIMEEIGFDLNQLREVEKDMGLGNGGLGRLAACFLDSMATLELPAYGYGIRYEFGIFDQDIENGYQVEHPDNWLSYGNPWEIMRQDLTYKVRFGGHVLTDIDSQGKLRFTWADTDDVLAVAYDVPVPGYQNNTVNNLRLWQAKSTDDFNFEYFNKGNYLKAVEDKNLSETISKVLYPNDNIDPGKVLRLQQQFFFVSATLQDIIFHYKLKHSDFSQFSNKVAVQLNDTHPSLAIPELMRLLMDEEGMEWEDAWSITQKVFAYTNHTVLPEALEKWTVALIEKVLPRHLNIIYEINHRFLERARLFYSDDHRKVASMSIIEEGDEKRIRMANLAIIGSHSVNGVAALHTHLLKTTIFNDFFRFEPEKFNNKTNGITQRRWLREANPSLSALITSTIGDGWVTDLYELKKLEAFADKPAFQEAWWAAKQTNKQRLIEYIESRMSVRVNPDSIFDAQIKRFHEYKRQLLNVLHVIALYNRIKDDPKGAQNPASANFVVPRTVLFGGKAAPGYYFAKLVIKLINAVADVVNNDPDVGDRLKLIFLKNYSVSLSEKMIPASDLSEQVSTAGFEASGTGNMKFQLNGALTIGTMDGANVEMREEVGDENIFIFGLETDEVQDLKNKGYEPFEYYQANADLKRVLDMIQFNFFNKNEPGIFKPIYDALVHQGDKYCLLADFQSYLDAQRKVETEFRNRSHWVKKSILNTARVGKFSSDRTIREYADEIWGVESTPVNIADE